MSFFLSLFYFHYFTTLLLVLFAYPFTHTDTHTHKPVSQHKKVKFNLCRIMPSHKAWTWKLRIILLPSHHTYLQSTNYDPFCLEMATRTVTSNNIWTANNRCSTVAVWTRAPISPHSWAARGTVLPPILTIDSSTLQSLGMILHITIGCQ